VVQLMGHRHDEGLSGRSVVSYEDHALMHFEAPELVQPEAT